MTPRAFPVVGTLVLTSSIGCATFAMPFKGGPPAEVRRALISRGHVWTETNIRSRDLKTGPAREDAFPFRATVTCDFVDKSLEGRSPKFACRIGERDEVKVKYGGANGEVYGEERLDATLASLAGTPPQDLVDRLEDEIVRFVKGRQRDDLALFALRAR